MAHQTLTRPLLIVAFVIATTASTGSYAATASLSATRAGWTASENDRSKLATGKVIVQTRTVANSEYPLFRAYGIVDAPPAKVWKVVEDCANYDKHLPRIAASKLVSKSGQTVRCETELKFPAPFPNATVVSDAVHEELPGSTFVRTWSFVRGDFDENRGRWLILPFAEDGNQSLVMYETHAEPHAPVPVKLLQLAQKRALPQLFDKLRSSV